MRNRRRLDASTTQALDADLTHYALELGGPMSKLAVIAVGGNSLILDGHRGTIPEQFEAALITSRHIVPMIEQRWRVIVTHGNGPQVGFILLRSDMAASVLPRLPLDLCDA